MATREELAAEFGLGIEEVERRLAETGRWPDGHESGEPSIAAQHLFRAALQDEYMGKHPSE